MQWGPFDLKSRLVILPRGHRSTADTPDGKPGRSWKAEYGVVGLDGVGKDVIIDGMNEKGLGGRPLLSPGDRRISGVRPGPGGRLDGRPPDVGLLLSRPLVGGGGPGGQARRPRGARGGRGPGHRGGGPLPS